MLIWFLVFVAVCSFFAFRAVLRSLRGDGIYIAGERVSLITVVLALSIFVIAFGLFAATQLGFIPNHAP